MYTKTRQFLAFKRLEEDAALFLSTTPFYWEVFADGEEYRIGIPKLRHGVPSNLALSIGSHVASLRPDFETHSTILHILEDTTENRARIQALGTASTARPHTATPLNINHPEDDSPIDIDGSPRFIFNRLGKSLDLSGSDDRTCKEQIILCMQKG
jgi:hypothetical protein